MHAFPFPIHSLSPSGIWYTWRTCNSNRLGLHLPFSYRCSCKQIGPTDLTTLSAAQLRVSSKCSLLRSGRSSCADSVAGLQVDRNLLLFFDAFTCLCPKGERSKKKMLAYVYLGGGFITETHVTGVVVLRGHPLLAAAAVLLPGMITQQRVRFQESFVHGSDTIPDDPREAVHSIMQTIDSDNIQASAEEFRNPDVVACPASTPCGDANDVSDTLNDIG